MIVVPLGPRPVIEKLVVEALLDRLLQPKCVPSILLALNARRDERQSSADRSIVDVARQVSDAEERLGRLYAAIESGAVDGTDPTLGQRVSSLKNIRDRATVALDYARTFSTLQVISDSIWSRSTTSPD